jgi:cytochrome P450
MTADWSFRRLHEPFARLGEAFFVVSPFMCILYTDNAEVIRQVAQRREHFPKYTESYKILAQFGESVLTTEGAQWRFHRKVTSASFNERNAALVFAVAAHQAQGMLEQWEAGRATIATVEHDTMRLALNIIGYVGFGLRLLWPGQKLPPGTDPRLYKYTSLEPVDGHSMSFVDTIAALLENILMLLMVPPWLLSRSCEGGRKPCGTDG